MELIVQNIKEFERNSKTAHKEKRAQGKKEQLVGNMSRLEKKCFKCGKTGHFKNEC